ncbi:type II toxin-antitoxin system RelE/ParE family toxin [Candidatus Bathyarchaeota archaeon]|nr:type II toxin-antitoxin system RelE/ParE family toxin [Candidatus Bathyarchaeota archaeon]
MKYTVLLSRQAEKFYKNLEEKLKAQVRECLIGLEDQAYAGKRLHGDLKENCSLRVGKLRIIYTISEKDKIVYVVAMGPRKTIYQ